MAPLTVTMGDDKCHFSYLKPFRIIHIAENMAHTG